MPKLRYSLNARTFTGTWDITLREQVFNTPVHLEIENGNDSKRLRFISEDELNRFDKGIGMCRVTDENGVEGYVSRNI